MLERERCVRDGSTRREWQQIYSQISDCRVEIFLALVKLREEGGANYAERGRTGGGRVLLRI